MTAAQERKRRENSWLLVLNSQGKNGPMNQREDYVEAKRIKERWYEESEEGNKKIHSSKQVRQREHQPFSRSREGAERIDPKTGWKWYPSTASSSSSSSWRQSSDRWWQASSWNEQWFFTQLQGVSLTDNDDSLVSDGRCEHFTNPTHTSHFRTSVLFRVAQDLSHQVNR